MGKYKLTTIKRTVHTKKTVEIIDEKPRVGIEQFGADHWSTFAYIETRTVDHKGVPNIPHMRCDADLHPQFAHSGTTGKKYPTRIKGGELENHDDWSCLDDFELLGLLENKGTGFNRVYKLTALGRLVAAQLRAYKAIEGSFATFEPRL